MALQVRRGSRTYTRTLTFRRIDGNPEARVIYATAGQLFYEEQVCLLWVMYNAFSTAAGMVDSDATREV